MAGYLRRVGEAAAASWRQQSPLRRLASGIVMPPSGAPVLETLGRAPGRTDDAVAMHEQPGSRQRVQSPSGELKLSPSPPSRPSTPEPPAQPQAAQPRQEPPAARPESAARRGSRLRDLAGRSPQRVEPRLRPGSDVAV